MNKKLLLPLLLAFLSGACSDETPAPDSPQPETPADSLGAPPTIAWDEPSARFRINVGETLTLVPIVEGTDSTSLFVWTLDDRVVSTQSHYSFVGVKAGEYFVHLSVSNRYGRTEDEAKITVVEGAAAELPPLPEETRLWCFPWTEINVALGRSLEVVAHLLQPLPADAHLSWTLDGTPADAEAASLTDGRLATYAFEATTQGTHTLTLTLAAADLSATQDFLIHVCPPPGTFRRPFEGKALVNKVHAYVPAPGHQVNGYIIVGDSYPENCTHQQACDSVLAHFQRQWSVSLGSQGGYLVAGFDHSVRNSGGDYDLCVRGNPFSYQSEPGIIWVSQDDNGDGLPNDQWFELAGSEYATGRHLTNYAITYYRPEARKSATAWRDCLGQSGYVPYLSYWNPHDYYWQPWVEGDARTYFGSRLDDRSTYAGGISDIPPYDWGYVDNLGSDFIEGSCGKANYFRLSTARTWDGRPAELEYIDFVRIQTAQIGSTPNLGDISTEVYFISDCHSK